MKNRLLWKPDEHTLTQANLSRYQAWLKKEQGLDFSTYPELWNWSVKPSGDFWQSLFPYFNIQYSGTIRQIRSGNSGIPPANWFNGISLNYAENLFSAAIPNGTAIIHAEEDAPHRLVKWEELKQSTAALQQCLLQEEITIGDRVAAYIPCIPEATMALLATNGLGAIWSSCSPEFGIESVIDRFSQINPKVLIAVSHYQYGGKRFDKIKSIAALVNAIPSIKKVILITDQNTTSIPFPYIAWHDLAKANASTEPKFVRCDFNHPIWILYSSGTTGLPKAIVHSQGGVLLEQMKYHHFHHDLQPKEHFFWYTTTGWMMWNHLHGSLLNHGIMATYNGSPSYPNLNTLWELIDTMEIHHFGTSAGHLIASQQMGLSPKNHFHLQSLREIGSTGSILPDNTFNWVYSHVKPTVWLASMSGGTDVCTALIGGNPTLPVYEGEIQCKALGCALEIWDEKGQNVPQETPGEMVITQPIPSMPIKFWNDNQYIRYRESYFSTYPRVWRHGDWISQTEHNGLVMHGRSDATLNRNGIRIGTGELYRALEKMDEITDSVIVCIERKNGQFYMPLFVSLREKETLSDTLIQKIQHTIRLSCSPRHIPDEIIQTPDIPYTINGKKTEIVVKKILSGQDIKNNFNPETLRNPDSINFYISFYNQRMKNDR